GRQQRLTRLGIDFGFRHLADQQPVKAGEFLRHGKQNFAIALEAHRTAVTSQHLPAGIGAKEFGELAATAQLGARVDLDVALAVDEKHLAALAETELADHLRHGRQVLSQTGYAGGLASSLDALDSAQGWQARG